MSQRNQVLSCGCSLGPAYMDIKHLRRTCKLPRSFSTLIHSNDPPNLSQMTYLRGVSSNIAAHLLPIKADLNYFLDEVQVLQPDIQGVTLSCLERLRSLCEGDSSHPQHLCPHCHYHILLHDELTSGLDMTPSFSCMPSDKSDDRGASCLEPRLSRVSIHEKYDRFSKIIHELHAAYSILTQALAFHKKILSPIRYMPRDILEEIFIRAQDRDGFLVFRTTPSSKVPALERFEGQRPLAQLIQAGPSMPVQIDAFESAQNLEAAYMFGLPATLNVRLPWTKLVAFEGLEVGTNLEMMAVIHRSSLGDFPVSENCIVNCSLRELHACDSSFLRSLVLPNLLAISIEPHFDDSMVTMVPMCPENALPALNGLILASHCLLQHLILKGVEYGNGDLLLSVLDLSSSLQELVITQHFDGVLIMRVLHRLFSRLKEHIVDIDGNRHYAVIGNLMKLTINLDDVHPTPSLNALGDLLVKMLIAHWDDYNKHAFRMLALNGITDSDRGNWFNPRDIFKLTSDHVSRLKGVKSSQTSCRDQYNDLLHILNELHVAYTTLNRTLGEYKRILSPIRNLPEDVLGEIFLSAQSDNGYDVLHVSVPPWSLGHVCRWWRDVAVSFPSLWSRMLIWAEDSVSDPLSLMQTVLARSSRHLLTVCFQYWPSHSYRCPYANEMFTLLTEQAHRWKILYFSIPPSAYHLLAPIRGRINCLQTLHLQHQYDIPARLSAPPPPTNIDVFESAENLEATYLFNLPHESRVRLPWSRLVDFADSREHTTAAAGLNQHLLDVLEAGINLKMMAVIHRPMHNETFPVNDKHVINTSLEELHACDWQFSSQYYAAQPALCIVGDPNLVNM
ncbi:hypothetical protein EV421DRAFT_1903108 [Armillaria borealis]|uniref:F-box domain-containing protein n=1 Tax=Armillaria borealis TaxID=47425 RepID=A0AA39MS17_9AGAR|nr:hypothetical protein EV421DRAFT_1903108 [Armillaria borealis]